MKKVIIFGSTGSIGKNALEVIRKDKQSFKIIGLCANRDTKTLYAQIKEFSPSYVCVADEIKAKELKEKLNKKIKFFSGEKGLREFASLQSDISLMAISGISCLEPLLINIKHTKRVALANKESIVVGGSIVFRMAKEFNTEILPVDSEINALYQIIEKMQIAPESNSFKKVYLTASGGSLYNKKDLIKVGIKEVLSHPTWKMGKRITIDSATLVNKGFETIESHYFFNLPYKKIDIIIHRESIVHALVEYKDNTIFACMYPPDMKTPIAFTFYYPQRHCSLSGPLFSGKKHLKNNLNNYFSCSFSPIRYDRYPLLKMILEAAEKKDNSLAVLNACDEIAIDYFLQGKISFTDIYKAMHYLSQNYPLSQIKSINDIFYWDNWARIKTKEYLDKLS